jgi:GDP-mannose 6-dehydrogenase
MRIAIFGLGYVGSVTAACLADAGHEVIGVDVDKDKVAAINAGQSPIIEPGLSELIAKSVASGRLRAISDAFAAVAGTDVAMLCVGTPSRPNGQMNPDVLVRVCRAIRSALSGHAKPYTVVVRSTVLPGTTESLLLPSLRGDGRKGATVEIAVNPEFMREGTALKDFFCPPLTVVGCSSDTSNRLLRDIYSTVEAEFVSTDISTAEMVKYAANAYHALKVCFANEIGNICEALGADPQDVMRIFRMDRKLNISDAYLQPGFAFGGSCLPKDVRALVYAAYHADVGIPVLGGILPSNDGQIRRGIERVLATGKRRISVAGLAFKSDTDDLRESPMVALVEALIGKGCDVRILDRNVQTARLTGTNRRHIEQAIPHLTTLLCDDEEALLDHAEVLVITGAGETAQRLLAGVGSEQLIVDLTQGALPLPTQESHEGMQICFQGSHTADTSLATETRPNFSRS